jgi:hypothetical protein
MIETFYLGAPEMCWLERFDVPMMISRRRLIRRKTMPRARGRVLLDSSGFTQLKDHGSWDAIPPALYVSEVQTLVDEVGNVDGAFIQDWMCEGFILGKTGLSVLEHQRRTVRSYLELRSLAPHLPWLPVIQGWTVADYLRCVDMYAADGVDLRRFSLVGVGSICSRQSTKDAYAILAALSGLGLDNLHGFGVKTDGLPAGKKYLRSADSMAWSSDARKSLPLPGCEHRNCANCSRYAMEWRKRVISLCANSCEFGSPVPRPVYRRRSFLPSGAVQLSFLNDTAII